MVCSFDRKIQGPYDQTLFLGCSISDFTLNLGWGSESSSCQVKLVMDESYHQSDRIFTAFDSLLNSSLQGSSASSLFDPSIASPDNSKSLTKNIIQKLVEAKNNKPTTDNGKAYWPTTSTSTTPSRWTEPDTGFIGNQYGIVGCPAYFKFHNVVFGGYIKKWTYSNAGTFDVELNSFGSLLNGCKLILQQYRGSVSTLLRTTGGDVAVPYGDPGFGSHNGTIAQGNIPNLFNVYGYLENTGFGNSGSSSERGISAAKVYDAIVALLGRSSPTINAFSPYGGIVARGVHDLSSMDLLPTASTKAKNLDGTASALNLTDLGILRTVLANDGLQRFLLKLDISEIPRPPEMLMLSGSEISLGQFINECCEQMGLAYVVDMEPDSSGSWSGTIKIKAVSRRIQPPANLVRNFMSSLTGNEAVISATLGEEFSDGEVRSVVVGGSQERLYQVASHTLSRYRNYNRYNPEDAQPATGYSTIFNNGGGSARNTLRSPLGQRYRWYDYAVPVNGNGETLGAIVAQKDSGTIFGQPQSLEYSNLSVSVGSYETLKPDLGGTLSGDDYPLYTDLISPYFGRDSVGQLRKVFFDKKMAQIKIIINAQDIQNYFPTVNITGSFALYENELRAALSGMDNWLAYITDMTKLGVSTPTGKLIYNYLRTTFNENVAKTFYFAGLSVIRSEGKVGSLPSMAHTANPITPLASLTYNTAFINTLTQLHNFIRDLGSQHYGKDFLVRMPSVKQTTIVGVGRKYDYEVCDSGWEEEGNFIDDTILIGTDIANSMGDAFGKFGVILGYNNLGEKYTILDAGGAGLLGWINKLRGIFTTNTWYFPLQTDLSPTEIFVRPWQTYNIPSIPTTNNPWASPIDTAGAGSQNLTNAYQTGFGEQINDDSYKYKIYMRGSSKEVAPENQYNTKMFYDGVRTYCVVSAPSAVTIKSPRSLKTVMIEDLLLAGTSFSPKRLMLEWALNEGMFAESVINSTMPSANNIEIAPRAALPCFAAVPVRLNNYTYGPWSSHPNLINRTIFPGASNPSAAVNNIVGGVKIDINNDLVPWNYGGIAPLDEAVLTKIADDNNYQQVIEHGQITTAGIQLVGDGSAGVFGVGARLIDDNMGPVINSMTVTIGSQGVQTSFTLRTYSRKLGFYNKEAADNIARLGKESLKRRKEIADSMRNLSLGSSNNSNPSDFSYSRPKALSWSPVSIIVGNAYPFLHQKSNIRDATSSDSLSYSPAWPGRPKIPASVTSSPSNLIRHQTQASIYDQGELPSVFKDVNYANTSMMSLDGLLSPISFYPTPHGSTYAITFYPRASCPYCTNGTYSYKTIAGSNLDGDGPVSSFRTLRSAETQASIPCPFCTNVDKTSDYKQSAKPSELLPPFIVASGTDLEIINSSQNTFASNSPIINKYTLNPMVMSNGEFDCKNNKQPNDSCGHAIDVVAFGQTLDSASGGLRAALSNTIGNNYSNSNVRSFGLRGPIMVHAWGYDTEGYPVPNASGEYKMNGATIVTDQDGKPVYKNQVLQSDGTYSAPYKENAFYKGWAQLPTTWPVGPIDLRWDYDAGVWTIGANYKPLWIVLENDLTDTNAVRGTILEGYGGNDPLPNNLRKLVFVKDSSRLFSAPRGAAIYCKYNGNNGFYEPIYNQPFITSGTIQGGSLATIYKAYNASTITPGTTPDSYQTNFTNPLNLNANINAVGLFVYLNGDWVLQSVKG